ncbi:MAG: hypothetical protein ACOYM3_27610 [Terrimicrobiaceae bacterium]
MRKLALSFLVLSVRLLSGQEILPPPKTPILARLPEFSSWTVTYRYADEARTQASPTPTPKPNPYVFSDRKRSVAVTKTGQIWSEEIVWTSGNRTDLWIYDNLRAGIVPGTRKLALIPFSSDSAESFDYRRMDFEGLEWIKPENYRGPAKWQGQLVYFFEDGFAGPSEKEESVDLPTGKWGTTCWAAISPRWAG